MRSQTDIIKSMFSLINQFAIKSLEQKNIIEVFFQFIRKMNIYSVQTFVKIDSTTRLFFND
jgi:hypothetical protein